MVNIKGVILAGGLGKRLGLLTRITNKHLLPVYNKPMIFYPLKSLVEAGIKDILIVTGGNHAGEFLRLLRNGEDLGLRGLHYAYQKGEEGIADALRLSENFAEDSRVVVILSDNILQHSIKSYIERFKRQDKGARILLKKVKDSERFGVPVFKNRKIIRIEEKPRAPKSSYAVCGIYMYDNGVFDIIKGLRKSARGEYEITDVNNHYLSEGVLEYDILKGWWTDCGTPESLLRASSLARKEYLKGNPRFL